MNTRIKLGFGLFAASCLLTFGFSEEKWAPGVSVKSDSLDSVVALGCGQNITPQAACKYTSTGCNPKPKVYHDNNGIHLVGFYCGNDGALLGCTGGANETCTGPIDPNAADKCAVSNDDCCTPTLSCSTTVTSNMNVPGGLVYGCGTAASTTGPVGTKTVGETLPCKRPIPVTAIEAF